MNGVLSNLKTFLTSQSSTFSENTSFDIVSLNLRVLKLQRIILMNGVRDRSKKRGNKDENDFEHCEGRNLST
jgi:hypothetical protein